MPSDFAHSRAFRIIHLVPAIIFLIWPYIFAAVVWAQRDQGGLQASDSIANLEQEDPRTVDFFVTAIVVVVSFLMTHLFVMALLCAYQDWVAKNAEEHTKKEKIGKGKEKDVEKAEKGVEATGSNVPASKTGGEKAAGGNQGSGLCKYWNKLKAEAMEESEKAESPFISFYKVMRSDPEEWPVEKMFRAVFGRKNRDAILLVSVAGFYAAVFTFISPGLNAILLPHSFLRRTDLQGQELDFSSTDPTCVEWFINNPIPPTCNWQEYNQFEFTNCLGENQLVDVLEPGRSNMRALVGDNDALNTLTFTQLGGVSFMGPIHGVFPIGPNGISAFNTLDPLPPHIFQSVSSYNYTVGLQGVSSDVNCTYDTSTPISTIPFLDALIYFNGSCPTGDTIPEFGPYFVPHIPNIATANNTLGLWPCSSSLSDSYVIYLNGSGNYADVVGDMSCTISLLQPSIYNVSYNSSSNLFVAQNTSVSSPGSAPSVFDRAISGVVNSIIESQNLYANLVVESVITYGVKYLNVSSDQIYAQDSRYLELFQALIQGMVDYEVAYSRMIFLSLSPPAGCMRTVSGQMFSEVIGWDANPKTVAYLIPLTLVSLSSIAMFFISIFRDRESVVVVPNVQPDYKKVEDAGKAVLAEQTSNDSPALPL